jgi:hypothetical protein
MFNGNHVLVTHLYYVIIHQHNKRISKRTLGIDNAQVILYDILGREMWSRKLNGSRMVLEKGNLEKGVYFVRVINNKRQYAQTIIVQ